MGHYKIPRLGLQRASPGYLRYIPGREGAAIPTIYDNKKVIPSPLVRLEQEVERNASGAKKRATWVITLSGTLVAQKGSPNSRGTFWTTSGYPPDEVISLDARLAAFRAKQGALCELFCQEGKWLEWQPFDGSISTKCQPRLRSKTFQEGIWVERCDYQFTFEADSVWFGSTECCAADASDDPCDESWDLEQADDNARTYRLVHTVSAQFRDSYNPDTTINERGWERAKAAVEARLGFQSSKLIQDGILNLDDFQAYNHTRSVTEGRSDGTYRVTETWLCFDPDGGAAAIEDYTVTAREVGGRVTVSVEGSVQGLYERGVDFAIGTSKYTNAAAKWAVVSGLLLSRAQAITTTALNPTALSLQVARNELTGLITYTTEYDSRYTYGDAISLEITLQDQYAADVFAAIPVVGRPAGPVLQAIGSTTETSRTVTVDAQFPSLGFSGVPVRPDLAALVLAYQPVATTLFVAKSDEQWAVVANRIQKTVTWVYAV